MDVPWYPLLVPSVSYHSSPALPPIPSVSTFLHSGESQSILEKLWMCREAPWAPFVHLTDKAVGPHALKGPLLYQWPLVAPSLQPPLLFSEACWKRLRDWEVKIRPRCEEGACLRTTPGQSCPQEVGRECKTADL